MGENMTAGEGTVVSSAARWIRIVAIFDLIVTVPMAIPGLADHYTALLLSGFGLFGSPSAWQPLPLSTSLFVVLAGILAVLWNGCRAVHPGFTTLARWDCVGRVAVAAAFVYFLIARDAPAVLWLFVASELLGAAIEATAVARIAREMGTAVSVAGR